MISLEDGEILVCQTGPSNVGWDEQDTRCEIEAGDVMLIIDSKKGTDILGHAAAAYSTILCNGKVINIRKEFLMDYKKLQVLMNEIPKR
jgi:hypothetical protein